MTRATTSFSLSNWTTRRIFRTGCHVHACTSAMRDMGLREQWRSERAALAGGRIAPDTVQSLAATAARQRELDANREQLLGSAVGVADAQAELKTLFGRVESLAKEVNDSTSLLALSTHSDGRRQVVYLDDLSLLLVWSNPWANTLDESALRAWGRQGSSGPLWPSPLE